MAKQKNQMNREFWESAKNNNYTFRQYFNRLAELSISMFEWKNLPDTVDARFLELSLFKDGKAVFFKDEDLREERVDVNGDTEISEGYLALRCVAQGKWNVYNVPIKRRAFASNGYNKYLTIDDSVIIYNNALRTNSFLDVEMFSKRLYNLDRIIDVNCNAQRTPVLVTCDETQRLTLLNLYKQYDGNEPVIFGEKSIKPDTIKAISTGAPFVSRDLYDLKSRIWNEALTYLGISNVNFQKKERMVSDEVMRSMGGVIANRYSRLNARRKACEEINKMFGLNIECNYREDFREADDEFMFHGDTGDGDITPQVIDVRSKEIIGGRL